MPELSNSLDRRDFLATGAAAICAAATPAPAQQPTPPTDPRRTYLTNPPNFLDPV